MIKATLKKVEALPEAEVGPSPFRSAMTGYSVILPKVGVSFGLWNNEPLAPGHDTRQIVTSVVQEIVVDDPGHMVFRTMNTVYDLVYNDVYDNEKE